MNPELLSADELVELDARIAAGETSFDEDLMALRARGYHGDAAALEAALERALCRGEDPPLSLEELMSA